MGNHLLMRNKIVLVAFPFDDFTGSKVRPAICLTESIGTYDHVVVAFITSKVNIATENSDLELSSSDINFDKTGLKVDSTIRLHRLITIPIHVIKRELGILPVEFHSILAQKIKYLFHI